MYITRGAQNGNATYPIYIMKAQPEMDMSGYEAIVTGGILYNGAIYPN